MKTLIRLSVVLLAMAAISSCKDDAPEEDPQKVPEVTLTAPSSTLNSISFTITVKGAAACSYLVTEKSSEGSTPTAETILKDGKSVEAETPQTCEEKNLDPGVTYVVWAAASNKAGYSEVKSLEATTTQEEKHLPAVQIQPGETGMGVLYFTISFTEAEKGAYTVVLKGETIPDAAGILKDGTQADVSKATEYYATDLQAGQTYVIAAAASNADGMSEVATLEMTTDEEPALPGLEADVVNHQFRYVEAMNYFGDIYEKGTGWYVIYLRDKEADADGNYPEGTARLCFELHADLAQSGAGMLPQETYTVSEDIRPWTCVPGKIISALPDGYQPDCTYFGLNGQYGIVESGTVTVEKTGDDYHIAFDFRTVDGHSITAVYEGDLKASGSQQPIDPDATTTLTDNYTIQFAPGEGTVVSAYYYGYDADLVADVWSVYMEPKVKDMNADGFMMDLLVDPSLGYAAGFPAGTPDAPDEYGVSYFGEPGHYLPGEYDQEGTMIHSWYLGGYVKLPNDEWRVTKYAAAKAGYFYISKSGADYTISVEYSDENWRTVTGTWTGSVATFDQSAAGAPARRAVRR